MSPENTIAHPVKRTVKAADTPLAFVLDVLDKRLERVQDSETPREDMCQLRLEVRQLRATLSEHAHPSRETVEAWANAHYPQPLEFDRYEHYYHVQYEKWLRA